MATAKNTESNSKVEMEMHVIDDIIGEIENSQFLYTHSSRAL